MSHPLIEITFPNSRSKTFPEVIKHCKLFDEFTIGERNVLRIYDVREIYGRWDDFTYVIYNVAKYSGSRLFYKGEPILPFKNDFYYTVMDTLHSCYYKGYKKENAAEDYCKSDWGCLRINSITKSTLKYEWGIPLHWFRFGYFKDEAWVIDKDKIKNIFKQEAEAKRLDICPVFSLEKVFKIVDSLPEKIELDDNWMIEYETQLTEKGFVNVPVAIYPRIFDELPKPQSPKTGITIEIGRVTPEPQKPVDEMSGDELDSYIDEMLKKKRNQ